MQFLNIENYQYWNNKHILNWIMSLENGRFNKYFDILSKTLSEEDVKGIDLNKVDVLDIKGWGIINFGDRKALFEQIQNLIQDNKDTDDQRASVIHAEGAVSGGYFK